MRLERLARYRLARLVSCPDGRWQVPADLIAQLESRERTHPRHLLRIEKARAPERDVAVEPISDSERERLALGQAAAERLGVAFVADPPRFQGRLAPSPSGPPERNTSRSSTIGTVSSLSFPSPSLPRRSSSAITGGTGSGNG